MLCRVSFSALRTCATRNYSATTALAQQLDPIQQLFLQKTKEYAQKSKAAGGKAVDLSPADAKRLQDEMDRVDTQYGAKDPDFLKFPTFQFSEPKLEPVGVDVQPGPVEEKVRVRKDKWTRDPDKPFFFL